MRRPTPPNRFERQPVWLRGSVVAATLLVMCVLVLLGAEAAVRIRSEIKHGGTFWGVDQTYEIDPATRLRMPIPNSRIGTIQINGFGFRSPPITREKPVGRLRIAFLGGSTTYCAEVSSDAMTWPALVVQALRRQWPALDLDYLNAGVPGYTVRDSLRRLDLQLASFHPDIVVIYHATNDLAANSYAMAHAQGVAPRRQEADIGWLGRHSLLVYLIDKNLEVIRLQHEASRSADKIALDQSRLDAKFRSDYTKLVAAGQNIAKLVVTVSFSPRLRASQTPEEQRKAAVTDLYYMPYMTLSDLLAGYAGYNRVIREVAKSRGALLVGDEDSIPADAQHYVDSVHFTDAGSRAMADRVARVLIAAPAMRSLVAKTEAAEGVAKSSRIMSR
jgi:lysophospholipase L1-like esterase